MGKVSYRPRKGQTKAEKKPEQGKDTAQEIETKAEDGAGQQTENQDNRLTIETSTAKQEDIQSTKIVGELGSDYHIYIEDYVYTYLYQLAAADYTRESSAALIGQSYSDSKEILIKGIIPICMDKLQKDSEWIDMTAMEAVEEERKRYFPDQQIIGWMHMQPGYGTMLTMKEVKEHQNVFEGNGTVCLLVDAINRIESLFVYEEDELKEQSGYGMYYERNEQMQQYMLDHPFNKAAKEEMKDNVVNQFREIGKMRKAEYTQRKNLNLTVMAASIILIALTAVIVKMNDHKKPEDTQVVNSIQTASPSAQGENAEAFAQQQDTALDQNAEAVTAKEAEGDAVSEDKAENNTEEEAKADEDAAAPEEKADDENKADEQEAEYTVYEVEAGDTLADICYKVYGSAERSAEVAKFNELDNTDQLHVGQELKMPK